MADKSQAKPAKNKLRSALGRLKYISAAPVRWVQGASLRPFGWLQGDLLLRLRGCIVCTNSLQRSFWPAMFRESFQRVDWVEYVIEFHFMHSTRPSSISRLPLQHAPVQSSSFPGCFDPDGKQHICFFREQIVSLATALH